MKKPRILVVEDDRIIASSLRMILEKLGYEVTALASTGQAAIREAEETKPDLVLMDIVLDGEMDGIEAARVIRSHLDIPIIYLTAHADHAMRERAAVTQPFGYLLKPIMKDDLRQMVEGALSTAQGETEEKRG
ncbi:MAG TPA: response regulator [Desulfomonilaceae bacterium]|nr:response regulator [Desulfomonilaceae bacterium]